MKYWYLLLLLLVFKASNTSFDYTISLIEAKSEIGSADNAQNRYEYEREMLADPTTGEIPANIGEQELRFLRSQFSNLSSARVNALSFESLGPFNVGGRTRAVAFDIRDEDVIVAGGVSGGIWKSTDGGLSWDRKSNPENRNSVSCLVQDTRPGHQDTWYHGTGEIVGNSTRGGQAPFRGSGIYKSTDNAETWNPVASTQDDPTIFNSQFQYIWNIVLNEDNLEEDEVFVAAFGGILRSLDGGDSWNVVLGQQLFDLPDSIDLNGSNASNFVSLERAPNGTYFAALSTSSLIGERSPESGFYVSENGTDWGSFDPYGRIDLLKQFSRVVIGINESAPNRPYFLVDANPIDIFQFEYDRIRMGSEESDLVAVGTVDFKTENVPNFGGDLGDFDTQGSYNMLIKVHPTNENIVFAGGTNLYRTTGGFSTSENNKWIGGYNPGGTAAVYPNHHPDQHNLLFYPSNPNKVLSTNDGGLRVSNDATADSVTWRSLNNGYLTSQFYTIAQSQVEGSRTVLGGMQDNGTDIGGASGVSSWKGILGGDGGYVATTREDRLWFAAFQNGETYRLELDQSFNILSFARIDPENLVLMNGSAFRFINPYIIDPNNQNRVFMAGGNRIFKNDNVSQIPSGSQEPTDLGWQEINQEDPLGSYTSLGISSDSKILYAGTNGGFLIKVENADSVINSGIINITDTNGLFPEGAFISSIAVNPDNGDHLMVIFSNYNVLSIFESINGGETFVPIGGNLEELDEDPALGPSIRWGEIIPTNSGLLYVVGTSIGIFSASEINGENTQWVKEATDEIGSGVITMLDYRGVDGSLVAASHGNGVFSTTVPNFKILDPPGQGNNSRTLEFVNAFPNPFVDNTTLQYYVPNDGIVRIDLIDSQGRLVKNVLNAFQFLGYNTAAIGSDLLSGGIYFAQISFQNQTEVKRIALVK